MDSFTALGRRLKQPPEVLPNCNGWKEARWEVNMTIAAGNCKGLPGATCALCPPSANYTPGIANKVKKPARPFAARWCNSKRKKEREKAAGLPRERQA